jgi:hypothetical protein
MTSSAQQLRAAYRFLSHHRKRVALLTVLALFLGYFAIKTQRDPFREDVFNRIEMGMPFKDIQALIKRSGCEVDHTSQHEIFMGSRHTLYSKNRRLSVDLSPDGRAVGKDYEVRPGQTWAVIRKWIRDVFTIRHVIRD